METAAIYTEGKALIQLPVNLIRPNPYQPRRVFDEQSLKELAESIKEFGVIQPISVREAGDYYELVAGERRLRASKLAEMETIPAIVTNVDNKDSALIALLENLQRENLNYMEEAEGYFNLIKDYNLTQEEAALRLGKSQSSIANKLRLLKLPDNVKTSLIENALTERHARALLKLPDSDMQMKILDEIIYKKLNVKMTEKCIEDKLQRLKKQALPEKKRKYKFYIKDSRIYINTIKKAVDLITETGGNASYEINQLDDAIEVIVKIVKAK